MAGYYLIRQVVSNSIKSSFKISTPLELSHLQELIKCLPGNIYVYLVDEKDNSNQNFTNELGKTNFNYHSFRAVNSVIYKANYGFSSGYASYSGVPIWFYCIENPSAFFPKEFFCNNQVTVPFIKSFEEFSLSEIEDRTVNVFVGSEYEKFIGSKYEDAGYNVDYRGLTLAKKDGGIDLIVENDSKIIFVQCKNWIEINNYQIESRDLRAFIGDCYLYLAKHIVNKPVSFHYIISDNQMLSDSAKKFLKQQNILQLKETRFEKDYDVPTG